MAQLRVKDLFQRKAQETGLHRRTVSAALCKEQKINVLLPLYSFYVAKKERKEKTGTA